MATPTEATVAMLFIVLYQEDGEKATVLGLFKNLSQANGKCIGKAAELDVTLSIIEQGVVKDTEPIRWDTAAGVSCWVEGHEVGEGFGAEDWGGRKAREDLMAEME